MIRFQAIVQDCDDDSFARDAFLPRWNDVHVDAAAAMLKSEEQKERLNINW